MAKQLSIVVTAKDAASSVVRRITSDVLKVGSAVVGVARVVTAPVRGLLSMLTSVKTLVGATLGVLAARRALSSFGAMTEELNDLAKASQRLQIGVEQLSSLKYTADLADVSFESLTAGLATANKNLGQFAATGGGRAAEAFRILGVRVKNAEGGVRDMTDLLPEIADAVNAIPDAGRRGFLVSRIFGDNSSDFLNLLAEGGDRLRSMSEEARRLGAIVTPEQARLAEEYRDAVDRLKAAWLGLRAKLLVEVGPGLTRFTNLLASAVAAVPEILGRLMTQIRIAFSNSPESEAARAALLAMLDSWLQLVLAFVKGGGRVVIAGVMTVLDLVLDATDTRLGVWFRTKGAEIPHQAAILINSFWKALSITDGDLKIYQARIDASQTEIDLLRADAKRQVSALRAEGNYGINFETDFPRIAQALATARQEISAAGGAAFTATDQVLGFVEALTHTAIPELEQRQRQLAGDGGETGWEKFSRGWKQAWAEWINEARDSLAQGAELARGTADILTNNLTGAINGVIQGTKSLKTAFREMASDTLKQISEIIVRLLVMRAIAGVAGGFAGGGASSGVSAATRSAVLSNMAGPYGDGSVFRRGYQVDRFGVGAAFMPGLYEGLYTRPTLFPMARGRMGLMGEAGPEAVMPLRRGPGGRLGVEASGGGGLVVNVNVTVQGGGRDARATGEQVGRAAAQAVIAEMRRSPAARDQLRRALS